MWRFAANESAKRACDIGKPTKKVESRNESYLARLAGANQRIRLGYRRSCQCCESHAKYLRENGIDVDVVPVPNYAEISEQAGVPSALQGCHMIKLDGYVFEGHITSEIIKRFLAEKPRDVVGLSLPGMPSGVPGMEGEGTGSHEVYAIKKDGTTATYATQ
jgi:hypothetical protein